MSFEQAVYTEVSEAVESATENDGVLNEQDREDQEVQNSLRMIERMYNHENNPDDAEARSWVLVGITKAAIEHNQDPQEIANLVFGEGVLSMNEFLADAFETNEAGNKEIQYRLPNGDILQAVYKETGLGPIVEWTDYQRLDDKNAANFGSRYISKMLYQFTKVENFDDAVQKVREKIWGSESKVEKADVKETVSEDNNGGVDTGKEKLPPTITLDINPDGNVTTLDETGQEIELTFDELLARLATTHDKQWALIQLENIKQAHLNGVLNTVAATSGRDVVSQSLSNLFENPNLIFSIDEIINIFSSLKYNYNPENLDLSFNENTIREIVDIVFSEDWDLRLAGQDFRNALNDSSREIFDQAMEKLQDMYSQELVASVYTQTGTRLTGEQIQDMIGYSSYLMRDGYTLKSVSKLLGIPVEYLSNNDGSVGFRGDFPGISKDDINF